MYILHIYTLVQGLPGVQQVQGIPAHQVVFELAHLKQVLLEHVSENISEYPGLYIFFYNLFLI